MAINKINHWDSQLLVHLIFKYFQDTNWQWQFFWSRRYFGEKRVRERTAMQTTTFSKFNFCYSKILFVNTVRSANIVNNTYQYQFDCKKKKSLFQMPLTEMLKKLKQQIIIISISCSTRHSKLNPELNKSIPKSNFQKSIPNFHHFSSTSNCNTNFFSYIFQVDHVHGLQVSPGVMVVGKST